jgi:nitroreductase
MNLNELKLAEVKNDVHELIRKRWSPRGFSDRMIEQEQLEEIFEAASWAASAFNEQPWQYYYAHNNTPGFDLLWDCLMDGNKSWTKNAAIIFVALYRKTYKKNGKDNNTAMHDLGMANAQLLLQAASRDIYGHLMAGFVHEKVTENLQLDGNVVPVCMGVLGYPGNVDQLHEPYKSLETEKRVRNLVNEFAIRV